MCLPIESVQNELRSTRKNTWLKSKGIDRELIDVTTSADLDSKVLLKISANALIYEASLHRLEAYMMLHMER